MAINYQWVQQMAPWAQQASEKTGIAPEVILSQWGLETGWGTSSAYKTGLNLAGIKSTGWKGRTTGPYRAYEDLGQSVNDYVRVMHLGYYDQVRAAETVPEQIRKLDESPWAEDLKYGDKLRAIVPGIAASLLRTGTGSLGSGSSGSLTNTVGANAPVNYGANYSTFMGGDYAGDADPLLNPLDLTKEGLDAKAEAAGYEGIFTKGMHILAIVILGGLIIWGASMVFTPGAKEVILTHGTE